MFAILFEVLLIEIAEDFHHFAGWEGGLRGTKIVNKDFVNKLPFPISAPAEGQQQLKTTSDVTSNFPWFYRVSVL